MVEAEPRPGILSKIVSVPAKHNATIYYISFSTPIHGEKTITGLSFLDLTNADTSAEDLAEEVRRQKGVKSVRIIKPYAEGFVVDDVSPTLRLGEDRAIILRMQGYKGLISRIRERFGTGGEAFLYYIGFESGIEYGRSHMELGLKLGIRDPTRIFQDIGAGLFASVGFGRVEITDVNANPPKATLKIYDSFECELGLGSGKPYSHFIRGMIAGVLTALFNRKIKGEETKCIAKGDPYCEFTFKPNNNH